MKKLITNIGRIHTREGGCRFDSILIEDELIAALGMKEDFTNELRHGVSVIDAEGHTVLPGFIDSHMHYCLSCLAGTAIDLRGCLTKSCILETIHKNLDSCMTYPYVYCTNFNLDYVPLEEYPTSDDLEREFPDCLISLEECTGHMSISTKRTLAEAGVDWHDCICPLTGTFTGYVCGDPNHKLSAFFKKRTCDSVNARHLMLDYAKGLVAKGVTGLHAITAEEDLPHIYDVIDELPFRTRVYTETFDPELVKKHGLKQIGGCGKVCVDGDTTPYTAAMLEPYFNTDNYGTLYYSDEELNAYVRSAHENDLQIALHCVGDAASTQVINAIEAVQKEAPKQLRHRIEHFEFATAEMIRRVKDLDICLSVQPAFNHYWADDLYIPQVGPERAKTVDPLKRLLDAGIHVCFGSDCPVTPCDPLLAIHSALNHSVASERLDVNTAIDCQTYQSAYCGFEEDKYGSIAVGKHADLVILERDPLTTPREEVKDIRVLETIREGNVIYER